MLKNVEPKQKLTHEKNIKNVYLYRKIDALLGLKGLWENFTFSVKWLKIWASGGAVLYQAKICDRKLESNGSLKNMLYAKINSASCPFKLRNLCSQKLRKNA